MNKFRVLVLDTITRMAWNGFLISELIAKKILPQHQFLQWM